MPRTTEFEMPVPKELAMLQRDTGTDDPERIDRDIMEQGLTAAEAAVEMALAGAPYTEIARVCGYFSPASARTAVTRLIAAQHSDTEDYRALRRVESMRLNNLLRSVWDKATDPDSMEHLAYNRQAAALIEQHSKLHGLQAPQALQFVTPDSDVFEQVVARTAAALTDGQAQEADIFADVEDAEVVE